MSQGLIQVPVVGTVSGLTMAQAINTALAAIASGNSGASAPSTTSPNLIWFDTTTGIIKRRDNADTQWLNIGSLAGIAFASRSSNTIFGTADIGKIITFSSAFTQTFTAAATLGNGWSIFLQNTGTGNILLDPNASETINGLTTFSLFPGQGGWLICDGSNFKFDVHAQADSGSLLYSSGLGWIATKTLSFAISTTVTVTITPPLGSADYTITAGMNVFGAAGHARAMWLVGGDVGNNNYGVTAVSGPTNSGSAVISALSANAGNQTFTAQNTSGVQTASISVSIHGGSVIGGAPTITIA